MTTRDQNLSKCITIYYIVSLSSKCRSHINFKKLRNTSFVLYFSFPFKLLAFQIISSVSRHFILVILTDRLEQSSTATGKISNSRKRAQGPDIYHNVNDAERHFHMRTQSSGSWSIGRKILNFTVIPNMLMNLFGYHVNLSSNYINCLVPNRCYFQMQLVIPSHLNTCEEIFQNIKNIKNRLSKESRIEDDSILIANYSLAYML